MKLASIGLFVASSLAQKSTYKFEQGSSGDISCAFSGEVTLINLKRDKEVLWIKYGDQNPFPTTQNRFQSISSSSSSKLDLRINQVQLEDEDTYVCENQRGEGYDIKLVVTVKPEVAIEEAPSLVVNSGEELQIGTCRASGAKPRPQIQWLDDRGKVYDANEDATKKDKLTDVESTLVLKNSNKEHHQRRFSCRISQENREITTLVAENAVNVRWAPENTIVQGDEEFLELNEAEITCQSSSNPAPKFSWFVVDANKTLEADFPHWKISDDGATLRTDSILASDNSAGFRCVASNDLAEEAREFFLAVTERPPSPSESVSDSISGGAAKNAMVYSIAAVICIVLLIAFCIVLKRTCITKKEVYKTEDKEERDSLAEAELEAGNKKEYFM
ncbi:unnamed protein product [Oikopleura dioica]|uniref:Ig-like domain-containing protein n=1 Tax=Oikopleura dioica TaxID=34765 RepID=E4YBU7_OIKDI|nr:unnamed protein product [Oikopleura dioica]